MTINELRQYLEKEEEVRFLVYELDDVFRGIELALHYAGIEVVTEDFARSVVDTVFVDEDGRCHHCGLLGGH